MKIEKSESARRLARSAFEGSVRRRPILTWAIAWAVCLGLVSAALATQVLRLPGMFAALTLLASVIGLGIPTYAVAASQVAKRPIAEAAGWTIGGCLAVAATRVMVVTQDTVDPLMTTILAALVMVASVSTASLLDSQFSRLSGLLYGLSAVLLLSIGAVLALFVISVVAQAISAGFPATLDSVGVVVGVTVSGFIIGLSLGAIAVPVRRRLLTTREAL